MSKIIKSIIVAAMLVGVSHVTMATEKPDQNMAALEEIRSETALADAQIVLLEKKQKLEELRSGKPKSANTADLKPMPMPIAPQFGNGFTPSNLAPGDRGGSA